MQTIQEFNELAAYSRIVPVALGWKVVGIDGKEHGKRMHRFHALALGREVEDRYSEQIPAESAAMREP